MPDAVTVLEYIAAAIVIIALVLAIGLQRAKHFDYLLRLRLRGRVVEKGTSIAVRDVEVSFVDRGLDYRRSKTPDKFRVSAGKSDSSGNIDIDLDYLWGFTYHRFAGKPTRDFEILVSKDGYEPARKRFNVAELKEVERKSEVDLGTMELSKSVKG